MGCCRGCIAPLDSGSWLNESRSDSEAGTVRSSDAINPEENMNYRKVLLRIVFWALGLAAGFGAAGVIFAGEETLWRIVGTCAATAIGALVLLAAAQLTEAEESWLAGLMAIWLTVIEYLVALGLIWEMFGQQQERVGMTAFVLAATGIPAISFARVIRHAEAWLFARVGLAACAAVFVLLEIGTLSGGGFGQTSWRWHETGMALAGFSILAALSLLGARVDERPWRWLGVAAAAVGFGLAAYAIALDLHEPSTLFICVVSVAAVVAHATVMLWCPIKPAQRWLAFGTVGFGMATGALIDLARIVQPWQEESLGRAAGATAIIAGCGTLAVLVLARLRWRSAAARRSGKSTWTEIALECPRCGEKQTVPLGCSRCAQCGLQFEVRVFAETQESLAGAAGGAAHA